MNNHTLAAMWLPCLVLIGGAVALVVYRRRAPRAALLALPVVVLLAVFEAYLPTRMLAQSAGVRLSRQPDWLAVLDGWGHFLTAITAQGVLVAAAMLDRRPRGHDGNT